VKIKATLYIQAVKDSFADHFTLQASTHKLSSGYGCIYVDVDEEEIEIECPEFSQQEFEKGQVEQLKETRRKHLADSHEKTKSLDEQIEKLLCIENKV